MRPMQPTKMKYLPIHRRQTAEADGTRKLTRTVYCESSVCRCGFTG